MSLRIGHLRQVVPDSLAFYFEIVSRETVCEGARLEQESCRRGCAATAARATGTRRTRWFRCPGCGGRGREVIAGDELEVESIEVEEAACTA